MNKVVLKEFKKPVLIIDIIFYSLFVVIGYFLLLFCDKGIYDPTKYIPYLFYLFAFFSIFAYFANRRKGNYELLLFGLINVIVATFMILCIIKPRNGFIIADAVLLYAILNVINNGISTYKMIKEKNITFMIKMPVSILLLFIGVFVVSALYDKFDIGLLLFGYYFIIFGLLSLLEPLFTILFNDKRICNYIKSFLYNESKEVKEDKKTRNQSKKKEIKINTAKRKVKESNNKIKNRTIKKIKK